MTEATESLVGLIREIRTCFNLLKSLAEVLSSDLGINPSMRAVLEGLNHRDGRTVPDLARERGVSRQHIQTVVNALLEDELVRVEENPEHKRSVLYFLTPRGTDAFAEIQKREASPVTALASALPVEGVLQSRSLIARLNKELKSLIEKEMKDDYEN